MFGSGFGQQASNNTSSFGFRQPQAAPQTTSLFGQPAQQPAPTPSFGAPVAPTGQPAASPFGSMAGSSPFGASLGSQAQQTATQGQGTGAVPFSAVEEKDVTKAGKIDRYETITMMPQYANNSLQELRWQDYQANRKGPTTSSVSGFGFGQSQNAGGSGAFGQPAAQSTFGNSSSFGGSTPSGGLFGQSGNTAGQGSSLFGGNTQSNTGSGFGSTGGGGIFGQNNNNNTTGGAFGSGTSAFGGGAPAPASTGFGFGSNSNLAGSNTGSAGGGLFGQSNPANSSGSLFGAKPATTGGSLFGQPSSGNTTSGFGFGANNNGQQAPGSSGFGSTGTTTGGSGLFGQNNNATGNAFGQGGSTFGGFGSNTANSAPASGGLFGQNNNQLGNTGGVGIFGQQGNTQQAAGGTGPFGQQNNTNSMFGQNNNAPNTGSSLFGQSNNNTGNMSGSGGLFGQNNTGGGSTFGQPQQQTGFGFGQTQNKPATGGLFGQSNTSGSLFGQPANAQSSSSLFSKPATGTSSLFGQTSQQNNQPAFGASQGTQGNTSGGLFGQPQQQQQQTGFGFGQNNAPNNTSTGSGPFGSSLNKPTGGLFGQSNTGTAPAGQTGTGSGGLFGNTGMNSGGSTSGGLFGSNNANTGTGLGVGTGGLFGNNNNQSGSTGSGLFGNKPATGGSGGLFGNTQNNNTTGGTSLFGNTGANNTTGNTSLNFGSSQPGSGGLFGDQNKTNTSSGGLFGNLGGNTGAANGSSTLGANTGAANGSSLFRSSLTGQQPASSTNTQSAPIASIDSNAYLTNPLFTNVFRPTNDPLLNEDPTAVPKNKSAKLPTGILLSNFLEPRSLPRGSRFSSKNKYQDSKECSENKETGKELAIVKENHADGNSEKFRNILFSNSTDDIILNSEAFDFARKGIKSVGSVSESSPQAVSVSTPSKTLKNHKTEVASPAGSISQIVEGDAEPSGPNETSADDESVQLNGDEESSTVAPVGSTDTPDNEIVDSHGYWISPAQHKLINMTLRELRKVTDFRVGQRTQGFVEFLEPVDLSHFSNVQSQVCGHIVVFGERSFCLYPIESERPPVGQGFNVKHRVTLYNVFARSRDTREPVKDPEHPIAKKFMKRLQTQGKFVSWSAQTGTWTFEIDPASK